MGHRLLIWTDERNKLGLKLLNILQSRFGVGHAGWPINNGASHTYEGYPGHPYTEQKSMARATRGEEGRSA